MHKRKPLQGRVIFLMLYKANISAWNNKENTFLYFGKYAVSHEREQFLNVLAFLQPQIKKQRETIF
jgi:hypothetical protein